MLIFTAGNKYYSYLHFIDVEPELKSNSPWFFTVCCVYSVRLSGKKHSISHGLRKPKICTKFQPDLGYLESKKGWGGGCSPV